MLCRITISVLPAPKQKLAPRPRQAIEAQFGTENFVQLLIQNTQRGQSLFKKLVGASLKQCTRGRPNKHVARPQSPNQLARDAVATRWDRRQHLTGFAPFVPATGTCHKQEKIFEHELQ